MIHRLNTTTTQKIIEEIGLQLMIAVKTAPKARGKNSVEIIMLTDNDKLQLAKTMDQLSKTVATDFFKRDAENVRNAQAVLLLAVYDEVKGLNCQYCGFNCADKPSATPCVFNVIDLGIALGSAVSSAMHYKLDNRIMYSAGKAALKLQLFDKNMPIIFAIPLSASEKNMFFDRK